MKVKTSRFGEIEIDEGNIIHMPEGIIGFPEQRQYVILRHSEDSPFFWYQSVDDPEVAFVITNPVLFKPDYHIHFTDGELEELETPDHKSLGIFAILTIPYGKPQETTANLLGPLIINMEKRLAKQIILKDSPYTTRHPIMRSDHKGNDEVIEKSQGML